MCYQYINTDLYRILLEILVGNYEYHYMDTKHLVKTTYKSTVLYIVKDNLRAKYTRTHKDIFLSSQSTTPGKSQFLVDLLPLAL